MTSEYIVGSGVADELPKLINKQSKVFLISDENVFKKHCSKILDILTNEVLLITLPSGEAEKNLENLTMIMEKILDTQPQRTDYIVSLGGGMITDIAGLTANLLLRGIKLIHIPTTLIGCVDSSIGGKAAINSTHGKNLIGTFYPAESILIDVDFLSTLTMRDFRSGYAEVVKSALICDKKFFHWLEHNLELIIQRDINTLVKMIKWSCDIKNAIVTNDLNDTKNIRNILNFGHTLGHAMEYAQHYSILHGEAVSVGMHFACKIAEVAIEPVTSHLKTAGLPIYPYQISEKWDLNLITRGMRYDKKCHGKHFNFILLNEIGKAYCKKDLQESYITNQIQSFFSL